jgi:hypothetical protein
MFTGSDAVIALIAGVDAAAGPSHPAREARAAAATPAARKAFMRNPQVQIRRVSAMRDPAERFA